MSFVHAKTLDTRWGLGLARITLDERTDCEMVVLSLWAPVGENEELGEVSMEIALPLSGEISEETYTLWELNIRKMLESADAEKFEKAFYKAGIGDVLDKVCGLTI